MTHTNHELKVTGSNKTFTGATEYVTSAQISGSGHTFTPPAVQVPAAPAPVTFDIADYQPGGRAALAAGAEFHDMSSACGPKWNPSGTLAPGVYWVPCDVQFSGHLASSGPVTIAASGDIHVSGHAQAFVAPYIDNLLFISADASGSAIKTSGSDGTFTGFFYAPDGGIDVSGSDQTFTCGLIGDTIKITGSRGTFDAAGCPGGTAGTTIDEIPVPAPPLWVPTLDLTHTADRADVAPGQTIAYTTDTTNEGTTLVIPGIIAARNLDSTATATIDDATVLVEYQDAVTSNWVTLGTNTGPTPTATLASEPTPEDGVTYPTTGDRIAGTTIDAGAPASWAAAAVINLDPAQVTMLLDPAQVSGLRASATLTVSPSQLATRQVIGFDPNLLDTLRALGSGIDDTNVTVGLPDGTETIHTPTTIPALTTLAPGDTATVASAYTVAAPVPPAPEESPGDYTSRLAALDGTVLVSTGFARGQATIGPVLAPQQATLTTVRLPVLETAVTAPERVTAGAVGNWAIQITNTGTAPATAVAVEVAIAGVGPLPLVGVPASLAPGQSATVTASWLVPTDRFEPVVALSRVTWGDGAANTYGPLDFSQTSDVDTAPAGGVAISGVTGRFFDATATDTAFTATPTDTPIFEQAFPAIVFNPAAGTIPAQPAGIDDTTRPFTNVAIAANGRATGTVVAQGNGEQAGVGDLVEFQAAFDGTLSFAQAGTHNLTVTADAGFVLGIDGATRVAGELVNPPAATAFEGFDVVAAHNTPGPVPVAYQVTVSVPAPGDYPFELDYFDTNNDTLTLVLSASAGQARSLWLGNDMVGDVFQTDLNGAVLTQLPATPRTGVAHDGARLYVGDNAGNIEARSADGTTVLDTFNIPRSSGTAAEDLAWDTTRQRLWRIDNNNRLRKIDPVTETQEAVYNLPTSDTVLGTLGGIGVDYDEARDLLYVSYCKKTPCQDNGGLVQTVDPDTGTVTGNLFRTVGEFTGGLAYDPLDDTLWVGRHFDVAHYTLDGTFLGAFPRPTPGAYVDGLALTNATTATIAPPGGLVLSPAFEIPATTGTPEEVSVYATDPAGNAAVGVTVTLTVTGAHPTTPTAVTNSFGIAVFTLTAATAGNDLLQASATIVGHDLASNANTIDWTTGPPGTGGGPGSQIDGITPDDGTTITEPTPVTIGTVTPPPGETVDTWQIIAHPADRPDDQIVLAEGTGNPPTDPDQIAVIDPTVIDNGIWIIAIEVVDTGGGLGTTETSVVVDGQLKLGRYHITYQDLAVPVGGIPIQVLRTYDTLNKDQVGDFGNGWTLDVSDFRVQINRPLGDGGWERYGCGGGIIFVSYCFRTSRSHYVTVTWPDGRTETFDFTPKGLSSFFGAGAIASYTPRPAATSTLEPAGGANLGWTGDGNLYDDPFTPGTLYDPDRFVLVAKDGTRYTLDRNDGLIEAEDRNGNTVTIDDLGIHSSNGPDIEFTRDGLGRITAATGPDNESVIYDYTPGGDLDTVTDQNGHTTSFEYVDHALAQITDPLGNPYQRLEYSPDGRLEAITDANNNRTEITTDVGARTESVTSPDGRQITLSTFDERGNATSRDDIFDGDHHLSTWTYSTDDRDQIMTRTDPNLHTWTADYTAEGDLDSFTDAIGHSTTIEYDDFGQPLTMVDELEGSTNLAYDTRGNLVSVVDPEGRERSWTYNGRGDVLTESDELGLRRTWTYTSAGRVSSMIDALGSTTYGYDASGRVTSEQRPEGQVNYVYDDGGQLLSMLDPSGLTAFAYDNAGRITSVGSAAGTVSYAYRPDGRRQSMTTPDAVSTYDYDAAGRVTTIADTIAGTVALTHTWGGIDTVTRPNGVTTDNSYDQAGRLTRIDHASTSGPIDFFEYTLDPSGTPTSMTSTDGTESYTYDDLNRLTAVAYPDGGTETYSYNSAGDRTASTLDGDLTTYAYDSAGRLSTVTTPAGTIGYTWDGNGNLISTTEGGSYTWTSQNMMASATVGTISQSYEYDAAGLRVGVDGDDWLWDRLAGLPTLLHDDSTR